MARNQQTFETIVTLNAQSAQDELKKMKQNLDDLKKKKQDLLDTKNYNPSDLRNINKEIRQSQSELKAYNSKVKETIDVQNA